MVPLGKRVCNLSPSQRLHTQGAKCGLCDEDMDKKPGLHRTTNPQVKSHGCEMVTFGCGDDMKTRCLQLLAKLSLMLTFALILLNA